MSEWAERAIPLIEDKIREMILLKDARDWEPSQNPENYESYLRPTDKGFEMGKCTTEFAKSAEFIFNGIMAIPLEVRWGAGQLTNAKYMGPERVDIIDEEGELKLIYVEIKNKWPIDNREIIYVRSTRRNGDSFIIAEVGLECPEVPVSEGLVRATIYTSGQIIEPTGADSCRLICFYHMNANGTTPDMIKGKISVSFAEMFQAIFHRLLD